MPIQVWISAMCCHEFGNQGEGGMEASLDPFEQWDHHHSQTWSNSLPACVHRRETDMANRSCVVAQ